MHTVLIIPHELHLEQIYWILFCSYVVYKLFCFLNVSACHLFNNFPAYLFSIKYCVRLKTTATSVPQKLSGLQNEYLKIMHLSTTIESFDST